MPAAGRRTHGATVVAIPPATTSTLRPSPSSIKNDGSNSALPSTSSSTPSVLTDPKALVDAIEAYGTSSAAPAATGTGKSGVGSSNGEGSESRPFDPVEFLNRHFSTEASLVKTLPSLRSTIDGRIAKLDESISSAIQRQAELADTTAADVAKAKAAILGLHRRVTLVQSKARASEQTVLDITRDMKRLDFAKKHLSRTITALKRLHMLLHAASQLRSAASADSNRPFPDYATAANLIDATRLLLGHFDGYMSSVQKLRDVRDDVGAVRLELREGIVRGFRVAAFGVTQCIEQKWIEPLPPLNAAPNTAGPDTVPSSAPKIHIMPPNILADACLVIDALGAPTRVEFIDSFCTDQLRAYLDLFDPTGSKAVTASKAAAIPPPPKPSFKIKIPSTSSSSPADTSSDSNNNSDLPHALDNVERRYAWFRRTLKDVDVKFRPVFPARWNFAHALTHRFLIITAEHYSKLLSPSGPHRDKDREKVDVLLKALQKTILFEREMTVWLRRECGIVFLDPGVDPVTAAAAFSPTSRDTGSSDAENAADWIGAENSELEFDDEGRAARVGTADAIRIKYERNRRRREEGTAPPAPAVVEEENRNISNDESSPPPVRSLIGVATSSFEGHMGPYIALEEQNMDEQLVESTADSAVDTRGEWPVFISSTALFLYIKNSVTRCTALTKGRTFCLLYEAFKDTLRKYATVLAGKFPAPIPSSATAAGAIAVASLVSASRTASSSSSSSAIKDGTSSSGSGGPSSVVSGAAAGVGSVVTTGVNNVVGGIMAGASASNSSSNSSQATYNIPPGEEVTVCHVIDTCEYCADTVEALADLIRDKIDDEYKEKISMDSEQEAFHDVTAKGLRVLVSGLEQRTEPAFRDLVNGTNWSTFDDVGEESKYVRTINNVIQPFVVTVRGLIPASYFRSFCDKFASSFTSSFYSALVRLKKISEAGSQQLLLDVYNLKTLLLKLPVLEKSTGGSSSSGTVGTGGISSRTARPTIAPAMYTKMVTKQFGKIEILLKLVGTPSDLLLEMFKSQWEGGSALDFQTIMCLKGMKRSEQTSMLEKFGVDSATALKATASAATVGDNLQELREKGSDVAAKVNSDLSQMRQKVDDFRKAFR